MKCCLPLLFALACVQSFPVFRADDGGVDAARLDTGPPADAPLPDVAFEPPSDAQVLAFGRRLSAGYHHACTIARSGLLSCWGRNLHGQLGTGDGEPRQTPAQVDGLWFSVAAGGLGTCGIRQDRSVWCWGDNEFGAAGDGTAGDSDWGAPGPVFHSAPRQVDVGGEVAQLDRGRHHACVVRTDGALFCWGWNLEGQIGQGGSPSEPVPYPTPTEVPGGPWRSVSTGEGHTCAITETRELRCWGRNSQAQLGVPGAVQQVREPLSVEGRWQSVTASQMFTCAITVESELQCWGEGLFGRTGHGDESTRAAPEPVAVEAADHRAVDADWFAGCSVRIDGSLWCWGWNNRGELGLGDEVQRTVPTRVGTGAWIDVAVGRFFSCALGAQGVACAGVNEDGQLGRLEPPSSDVFLPL